MKSENKDTHYNFIYFFLNLFYFQFKQSFILYKTTRSSSTDFFFKRSAIINSLYLQKYLFKNNSFFFNYGNIKYHSWICINIWYVITHSSEMTIKHNEMGIFFQESPWNKTQTQLIFRKRLYFKSHFTITKHFPCHFLQ